MTSCERSQDVVFHSPPSLLSHHSPSTPPSHLLLPPQAPCQGFCFCAKQMNNHFKRTEEVKCICLQRVPASHPDCPLQPVCPLSKWGCQQVCTWGLSTRKRSFFWLLPDPFFPLNLTPVADVPLCTGPREILVVHLNKGQLVRIKEIQYPRSFLWRVPVHTWACGKKRLWLAFGYRVSGRRRERDGVWERKAWALTTHSCQCTLRGRTVYGDPGVASLFGRLL